MKFRYSKFDVNNVQGGAKSGKSSEAINWMKVLYMLLGLFVVAMVLPALYQLFKGSSTFAQTLVDTLNRATNALGLGKSSQQVADIENEAANNKEVLWGAKFSQTMTDNSPVYEFNNTQYDKKSFAVDTFLAQCENTSIGTYILDDTYSTRIFALVAYLFNTGWTRGERYSLLNSTTFFDYVKQACLSKFQFKYFCAWFNRIAVLAGSQNTDVESYLSFSYKFLGFIPYGFVSDKQIAKIDTYVRALPDTVDEDPDDDSDYFVS